MATPFKTPKNRAKPSRTAGTPAPSTSKAFPRTPAEVLQSLVDNDNSFADTYSKETMENQKQKVAAVEALYATKEKGVAAVAEAQARAAAAQVAAEEAKKAEMDKLAEEKMKTILALSTDRQSRLDKILEINQASSQKRYDAVAAMAKGDWDGDLARQLNLSVEEETTKHVLVSIERDGSIKEVNTRGVEPVLVAQSETHLCMVNADGILFLLAHPKSSFSLRKMMMSSSSKQARQVVFPAGAGSVTCISAQGTNVVALTSTSKAFRVVVDDSGEPSAKLFATCSGMVDIQAGGGFAVVTVESASEDEDSLVREFYWADTTGDIHADEPNLHKIEKHKNVVGAVVCGMEHILTRTVEGKKKAPEVYTMAPAGVITQPHCLGRNLRNMDHLSKVSSFEGSINDIAAGGAVSVVQVKNEEGTHGKTYVFGDLGSGEETEELASPTCCWVEHTFGSIHVGSDFFLAKDSQDKNRLYILHPDAEPIEVDFEEFFEKEQLSASSFQLIDVAMGAHPPFALLEAKDFA